ncbi:MAG: protoheme IX farnesyltransferase [Gammaproteobacteria bacterium CG_4_10_14_0_8_um_filter_38_16]|nr:MAG: protoheme IX farnesyltransferase [Gammaproteobacteria bacterium CG_4_10_14_0_8_um_filter_38_16]PJA03150.1 MAG: protoheme IX farnesyltransferase [Gammaproteobacteria bacterium CG_4_10_14_0_2_um_filter_38_22]PJB10533.1 MAG: protoheme IX farnesyltransferase [Gammaproteobacteria bacterium CG_4_9_14_3_um_filter_38_9]
MSIFARANLHGVFLGSDRITDYLTLCKPRVVLLMILTAMVGMCLSSAQNFSWVIFFWGNIGIALLASSAAAVNHIVDQHIDCIMLRTKNRPLVQGKVSTRNAIIFSVVLCFLGMFILIEYVNALTAMLTFLTLIGYAGIYTLYLKHKTPQNIVIGGLAGAAPPLLGWVAMTGQIDPGAIILTLIIFLWTPPHFWALAIYRVNDYANADVPMLPVTHGIAFTKLNIVLYTVMLFGMTLMPFAIGMCGLLYLIVAVALNIYFLHYAVRLKRTSDPAVAFGLFRYSIIYLMALFMAMIVDHFVMLL